MTRHIPFTTSLCSLLFNKNLIQLITTPTHIQGNTLDLVITNAKQKISNIKVDSVSSQKESDHFLITFHLQSIPPKYSCSTSHQMLNFKRADLSGLALHLQDIDLLEPSSEMSTNNIDQMWGHLKHHFKVQSKPLTRNFSQVILLAGLLLRSDIS